WTNNSLLTGTVSFGRFETFRIVARTLHLRSNPATALCPSWVDFVEKSGLMSAFSSLGSFFRMSSICLGAAIYSIAALPNFTEIHGALTLLTGTFCPAVGQAAGRPLS